MVLVEEAKAGGTPRPECPHDDQNIRLLAGVAKPASVTVYDDSLGSPCVGGTLSSSDSAGRLPPVVSAGISFPVGPIDPARPDGPFVAGGPVGPFGTLSPSDCHPAGPAGPAGPYVAGGPVGPDGTLSPFASDHAGLAGRHVAVGPVGPFGTLSPSDCHPAGPAGPYVAGGPVGPDGTLSPFTSDHAGPAGRHVAVSPVGPSGTLSPSISGSGILVYPGGSMLLPEEGGPKFFPGVLTDDLLLGAAFPLPAVWDPRVASSLGEVLVGDCDVITEENITRHDGWSDPEVVGSSSVVARVGSTALPRSTDTTLVCVDECT